MIVGGIEVVLDLRDFRERPAGLRSSSRCGVASSKRSSDARWSRGAITPSTVVRVARSGSPSSRPGAEPLPCSLRRPSPCARRWSALKFAITARCAARRVAIPTAPSSVATAARKSR
jgi:hypothetical protein